MNTTVSAVYEHGSLRLLNPIQLPESSEVQIQIIAPKIDSQTEAFLQQLTRIHELLDALERDWGSDLTRTIFPQLLQTDLHTLWHFAQPPRRTLCSLLQLSAGHLEPETLTHDQIAAIRFVLEQLAASTFTEADIGVGHKRLVAAGLPSSFAFSPEMRQSYLDEL